MPGPAMHHMIADRLKAAIQSGSGLGPHADYAGLQALLADKANHPYLYFGCHGPDPWFFNTKDWNGTVGDLAKAWLEVANFINDLEKSILEAVPDPVLEALEGFSEAANEVIQDSALLSEIQQTFEDLGRLLEALAETLVTGLKRFVTEFNLFDAMEHPYRDGAHEGGWWWFDAMHYRRTGEFTARLLEKTEGTPMHLFALGYLSHVTSDTVGHAYVNLNAGGAYRSQAQRHKTLENFQDVSELLGVDGKDWNHSKLHAFANFNYTGTIDDDEPAEDPRCPPELAELLADLLNATYQEDGDPDPDYAKRIEPGDVTALYQLWYGLMRSFTETGTLPPPVSYSFTAELQEVWEQTMDNLGDAGDFIEGAIDEAGDWGILAIFIVLAALVIGAVLAAAAIADGIAGAVATLGTATIRYAACMIYEQLYNAYANFRLALALNGLGWPMREHLSEPRFAQFVTPAVEDRPSGGRSGADIFHSMPMDREQTTGILASEEHLEYPRTGDEAPHAIPAPHSYVTERPRHYAFGKIDLDRDLLAQLADYQGDEAGLQALLQGGERTLGNAMDLTAAMYDRWRKGERLPDFNLDADRGYASLCWTQDPDGPGAGAGRDPVNEPTELDTDPQVHTEVIR